MSQVTVNIVFDSIGEARAFFSGPSAPGAAVPSPQPQPTSGFTPVPSVTLSNAAPVTLSNPASVLPTTYVSNNGEPSAPAPTAEDVDYSKLALAACNAMIAKIPGGAGAAKSKEIMAKLGVARLRDVKDKATADVLIKAFAEAA